MVVQQWLLESMLKRQAATGGQLQQLKDKQRLGDTRALYISGVKICRLFAINLLCHLRLSWGTQLAGTSPEQLVKSWLQHREWLSRLADRIQSHALQPMPTCRSM